MDRIALVRAAARNHASWMEGVARVTGGCVAREGALRWIATGSGNVSVPFPSRASALPLDDHDPRISIVDAVPEYDAYGQSLLGLAGGRFWHAAARIDGVYAGHAWAHRVGDHAGIYDVDARPLFRRQGLGRALTLAVCRAAGAQTVVLNATGDGEALYGALGFRSLGFGRRWWRQLVGAE